MKLKSHSGAKKRIKFSSRGKMMADKPSHRHLLINKSKRQKKADPHGKLLDSTDLYKFKRLLPHS